MRVHVLGGFAIEGLAERDLGSRKARQLLKLLVLARGRPVSVDRAADVVWGDSPPARPAEQVGVLVSRLRGVLGAERIPRSEGGYAVVVDWLDIDDVECLGAAATAALGDGRLPAARAAARAALALARGPLLPDDEGPWVETDRASAQAVVLHVRRIAVEAAVTAGDHDAAAVVAEQALAEDPYDEVMVRALMTAHLAAGRPGSALAGYARARRRLADDLGVSPTPETRALHARALAATDAGAAAPAEAPATRPETVGFVGRGNELAVLDTALDEARSGTALVIVEGVAGIGKSTLVDVWCGRHGSGLTVLRGRCDELGRDLPLQPVADALADHLAVIGAERSAELIGRDAATLAALLGRGGDASATSVSDPETARARVFAALSDSIGRAGDGRRTVLVVEDVHRAGPSTLAWLVFARRRTQHTLVIVTTLPGGGAALDATHRVTLGPLDRDEVIELVSRERAADLHARSGGHPLLLAALAAAPAAGGELPATVGDVVLASVDALGAGAGATLRVAAALGADCDLDLLARISGKPVTDVLDHLEAAARAGIVVERSGAFAFRHDVVRELLESALSAPRRAYVHREAARALARRRHADVLSVAVHARQGGDTELAAASFVAAAEAAAARFDIDTAEEHLAMALELASDPAAYVVRARVRISRQAFDEAAADAERAIALGGGAPALEAAGWVAYYRRRYDEARSFADEAAARASDDTVRLSALALAGRVRHGAGDLAGAIERFESAPDGPPAVRGVADVYLGLGRLHQGRPDDALAVFARPSVDADLLAHAWAPLHLRFGRAVALGQTGRVADGLAAADELTAAVRREGRVGTRFSAIPANTAGWLLRWSGRGGEADERNLEALECTGGDVGPSGEGMAEAHYVALLDLADGALLRGDAAAAAEIVDRLAPLDGWNGTMAWHQRHRLGLLRAKLAMDAGDRPAAAELAAAVAQDAATRGARRYELLARAVATLADPGVPDGDVATVVAGLGGCAVIDGWLLIAALAAMRHVDAWRTEAERLAGLVVTGAGEHAALARRFVDGRLTAVTRAAR